MYNYFHRHLSSREEPPKKLANLKQTGDKGHLQYQVNANMFE